MPMSHRLLRPRASGAAFSPQSVSNLVTWWDFSDLSTLAQNSDGTGAVSANGDAVGYVRDKIGSANLTQTTNNLRGSLVTSGIGGRASVSLPNTSGAGWNFTGTPTTDNTYFIVARYSGPGSQWLIINAAGSYFFDAAQSGSPALPYSSGISGTPTYRVNGNAVSATRAALFTACGTNASFVLAIRGVNHLESTTLPNWPTTANAWKISTYTSFGFIGQLAEIMRYSRSLSAAEISSVESYLKAKWGTP